MLLEMTRAPAFVTILKTMLCHVAVIWRRYCVCEEKVTKRETNKLMMAYGLLLNESRREPGERSSNNLTSPSVELLDGVGIYTQGVR